MAAGLGLLGRGQYAEASPTVLGPLCPGQRVQDPKILTSGDLRGENLRVAEGVWVLGNQMAWKGPRLGPWAEKEDQRG